MPRRPEQNEAIRAERRQQILEAATPLFAHQGIDATSISQIAGAVGVSHGTVFLYFPTKDHLVRAALVEPLAEMELHYRRTLLGPGSPLERIRGLVYEQVRRFASSGTYARLTQQVLGQPDRFSELAAELYGFTARYAEIIGPIIEEGQRLGELAPADPRLLAFAYFSYLNGIVLIIDDSPDGPIWEELARLGLRLFGPLREV